MENFTTQQHQRDNQGNVVVENPGKTIANLREKQRTRNFVNGVVIAAMALTVVLTGTMLGATTAHNNELKAKISNLELQNQAHLNQRLASENNTDYQYLNNDPTPAPTTPNTDQDTVTETAPAPDETVTIAETEPAAPTATEDALMQRTWERRHNNPLDNLTSTFTSRRYLNQFYNPNTRHSDFISKKAEKAVNLPALSPEPVGLTLEFMTITPEANPQEPQLQDLKMS